MSALRAVEETIEVPRGAGIEAFVRTVRALLVLPRVQDLSIDARGVVRCTRYVPKDEEHLPLRMDFDPLMPYALVRAAPITELPPPPPSAPVALLGMFDAAARESLAPIAWITGAASALWPWLEASTSARRNPGPLFGLDVHADRLVEDDVLLLAAGYARSSELSTLHKSFKLCIPEPSTWIKNTPTNASSAG